MEFAIVAICVDPGGEEDVEEAAFRSCFGGGIAAIFPKGIRESVVESHFAVVTVLVLPLQQE